MKGGFRGRVVRFYEEYQPEKLGDVDKLMAKTAGNALNEERLMGALVDKYGPEPLVSDPKALRRRVVAMYRRYNEAFATAAKVDDLVRRTKGKAHYEARLVAMLVEKYGEEPEDDGEADGATAGGALPEEEEYSFVARLTRFYEAYAPTKVADIPKLVAKTNGVPSNEDKLMFALVQKYGPEPEDSSSSDDDDDDDDDDDGDAEGEGDEEDGGGAKSGPPATSIADMVADVEGSPLRDVTLCPVDGMPPEYCEYLPSFEHCVDWLVANCPDLVLTTKKMVPVAEYAAATRGGDDGEDGAAAASSSKRGGAARPNQARPKKAGGGAQKVTLERVQRQKRKFVTSVLGLDAFDVKLKDAAKTLGRKFACGASVNKTASGKMSIDIQGDYMYELPEIIVELFPAVAAAQIAMVDTASRKAAKKAADAKGPKPKKK